MWVMCLNHVCDIHVTESGDNACEHGDLTAEERQTEWLTPGSDAHKALQDVVCSPRTAGLAEHVATFR